MKIQKQKLIEALEIVKPGLANQEVIEQSTSFAFLKGRVVTYNDKISISHPLEGMEIEGAIEADKFYALLNKIKKDEIEIILNGNEIQLSSGRAKAGMTLQAEITLPLDQELSKKGKWFDLPEKFNKLLKFAMSSASRNNAQPLLKCVFVDKNGYINSSDNYRITSCNLGVELPVKSFLIPASTVSAVVKLNPIFIAEGNGWIHFKTEEGTIISCRIYEEDYPDVIKHLTIKKGIKIEFPKSIDEVLERAGVFAKRDSFLDENVTISLTYDKIKLSAKAESGWFEETLNMRYAGEGVSFDITPYLLKDILKETLVCTLGEGKLVFEGSDWKYLSALRG